VVVVTIRKHIQLEDSQVGRKEEKRRKNNVVTVKPLHTSIKEKETLRPKDLGVSSTREKEELVRGWRVTDQEKKRTGFYHHDEKRSQ